MSYYDNPQWSAPSQNNNSNNNNNNNWDHQGATTPVRTGANGPQPQDDYAFSYQFDEVDRAHENLQKSGKGFGMSGRHNRVPHGGGPRPHSVNNFDDSRGPQGSNLHNFYAQQRHQPSRGSNEAEQVMQAKRRMAAQRERELRNLHTEQQYQRSVLSDAAQPATKHMSEEETRELIARQRSALYGEGASSSQRGHSPLAFDSIGRVVPADAGTPGSSTDPNSVPAELSPRPQSTASPQTVAPTNKVFDNAVGPQSRTSTSSPTNASPPRGEYPPGSKVNQQGTAVAPIGTRPTGTPIGNASAKRSTTPHSATGWGRGNGVWNQSGLGAQASVWG